ncbi:preprotein translocase subunit SecD [Anopheles sinensis]|uniref:Preprotein translocase subunit SecD n=1 Tax=Anopheles sinensis TaxID=74873 RepID=A0A084VQZ9_ANOSI|nr:preprotein translocase subunit SecD [Anopheles sinensis]
MVGPRTAVTQMRRSRQQTRPRSDKQQPASVQHASIDGKLARSEKEKYEYTVTDKAGQLCVSRVRWCERELTLAGELRPFPRSFIASPQPPLCSQPWVARQSVLWSPVCLRRHSSSSSDMAMRERDPRSSR